MKPTDEMWHTHKQLTNKTTGNSRRHKKGSPGCLMWWADCRASLLCQVSFDAMQTLRSETCSWNLHLIALTLYSPLVTICTASLTFSNPTFCPHSVFMCFVWISEQTAIISLYNINWLVFITEMESVYCAVRTGCLLIIYINLMFKRQTQLLYT